MADTNHTMAASPLLSGAVDNILFYTITQQLSSKTCLFYTGASCLVTLACMNFPVFVSLFFQRFHFMWPWDYNVNLLQFCKYSFIYTFVLQFHAVTHLVGDNTDLPSNSNITKTVTVNITFTSTFLKNIPKAFQ